jgi:integrase/recombinase XerD
MTASFGSSFAEELAGFLRFKRSLGYSYLRAEYTLREFDRFLQEHAAQDHWRMDQAMLAWLASKPKRKAVSVSMDAAVLRQFCVYLRRVPAHSHLHEPIWPRLPTETNFVPYILTEDNVRQLVVLSEQLGRPAFRSDLYRALILLLYCTGLRFGEALRLRLRDVDTSTAVLWVEKFKGRARWVPFHRSLSQELEKYLAARRAIASPSPDERFFVGSTGRALPVSTAHGTLQKLFQKAGLKPARGRVGPRPYDFRHAFAIQRLSRWYREGADLHSRLPWLSAYMGHTDILGTEAYLTATPELLELVGARLHRRYLQSADGRYDAQ